MKLAGIVRGRGFSARVKLAAAELLGEPPSDSLRLSLYRPEVFSGPMNAYLQSALRGPSEWSVGERELLAAFVSRKNGCEFGHRLHRAIAERALGARSVDALFEDYRSAPHRREFRAVIAFAAQLAERPASVGLGDVAAVLSAGVSREALETAIHVTAAVTAMNRVADALGFQLPSAGALAKLADHAFAEGYG